MRYFAPLTLLYTLTTTLTILTLLILPTSGHKHWWEGSSVLELTIPNWNQHVGAEKHLIVEFYTPWCRWCATMAPEYEKLREYYNGKTPARPDVEIARINAHDHRKIAEDYGIFSYPTILHFRPGETRKLESFNGDRRLSPMKAWIEKICGAAPAPTQAKPEPEPVPGKVVEPKSKVGGINDRTVQVEDA